MISSVAEELRGLSDAVFEDLQCQHGISRKSRTDGEARSSLEQCLSRCPICLCSDDLGNLPFSCSCQNITSNEATRCPDCLAPFHQACLGRHALAAVGRGQATLVCPVDGCHATWPQEVVEWALAEEDLERYRNAVQSLHELRCAAEKKEATSAKDIMTGPEKSMLLRLGIRACPRCGSLIEKQGEGLMTGCDKMTCRCGCMFCFKCGLQAADGVARCRCVGAHHSFIPHSQVLGNYVGSSLFARDQDLTKKSRGPASKATAVRLRKELKILGSDPPPYVHVRCEEANILSWSFLIEGPPHTPFEGGWYFGRLDVPADYSFSPPLIRILTPNGRFDHSSWLCRSVLDYHPEGWQPTFTLASVLMALLSLMCEDSFTPGAIHPPESFETKRRLATESMAWNRTSKDFIKAFPDIDDILSKAALPKGHGVC